MADQELADMRITFTFDGLAMTASLHDNPTARDLYATMPSDLSIEDFSTNEKIVHLPRRLSEEGAAPFGDPEPGDLCYYVPWGNLALFYGPYAYGDSLIRLGRFEDGFEPLLTRGSFPLRLDRMV